MSKPALTAQQEALTSGKSAFCEYKQMAVGDASWPFFLGFEVSQLLLSNVSGILGMGLRTLVYPRLFRSCGKRPAFGRGVLLRNPSVLELGEKILIDDFVTLDARGISSSLVIGDYASVGRLTSIVAKNAQIHIGPGANIGSYCRIATESRVEIGESSLIAAYCYIGPGNHQLDCSWKKYLRTNAFLPPLL